MAKSKKLRGLLSHPEYAHGDDGVGDLVDREVLTYASHGKVFADEAYLSKNFRCQKINARDTRRLRAIRRAI